MKSRNGLTDEGYLDAPANEIAQLPGQDMKGQEYMERLLEARRIDYTRMRKGATNEVGDIDVCVQCGRKGAHSPEGFNSMGTKVFRGFYIHHAIEDQDNSTLNIIDYCEEPWSSDAMEVIRVRSKMFMEGSLDEI